MFFKRSGGGEVSGFENRDSLGKMYFDVLVGDIRN